MKRTNDAISCTQQTVSDYNINIHKKVTYDDELFYADVIGDYNNSTCSCQDYRKLNEPKQNSQIVGVDIDINIKIGGLSIDFQKGSNKISVVKRLYEQSNTNNISFADKSRNNKVVHMVDIENDRLSLSYNDLSYRYASSNIDIKKGVNIIPDVNERIILPEGVHENDFWVYIHPGACSSDNPITGEIEMIGDYSAGKLFNFKFVENLFDMYNEFISNIVNTVNNLNQDMKTKEIECIMIEKTIQHYSLIDKFSKFLDLNIMELSSETTVLIDILNKLHRDHYIYHPDDIPFTSNRLKYIDYVYKIYRNNSTDKDIINISKEHDKNYCLYFRNMKYKYDNIEKLKIFLQNLDKPYEIVSLETSTNVISEKPLTNNELTIICT